MPIARVAISGFGRVGRRTAELLLSRRARYRDLYGIDVRLVAVCGSRDGAADPAGLEAAGLDRRETGRTGVEFVADSGADILIEAGPSDFRTGGPGLPYLRAALGAGRDAIVISKGALVFDSRGLRDLARSTGATLKISGATAAALPTIDLIEQSLKGCQIHRVDGVLNATTNYLLNAMTTRGVGFDAALREAQAGGFAESDPRYDVEGWDTACKLLILANFALDADLSIDDLSVQGIQAVTREQIERWAAKGLAPRLVGSLVCEQGAWRASVGVQTYPLDDAFAHIPGKTKAIRIRTDVMGEVVAMGGGAEPTATASAALKDLEHILQARASGGQGNRSVGA